MLPKNYFASIIVVQIHVNEMITLESIAVTNNEVALAGAWTLSLNDYETISSVISSKSVIVLGDVDEFKAFIRNPELRYLDVASFLQEAKIAAAEGLVAFDDYLSADKVKRKKLVRPIFYDWPDAIDFNNSTLHLKELGKLGALPSTPSIMKSTLATARLVQHLVEMWHSDEQERNNRKYIEGESAEITILPRCWL